MKLIHLTDTHLVPAPLTLYGLDPRARLDAALGSILADHGDADALIFTGDLAHWGERPAYEALKKRIATLPMPTVLMIGNHDERAAFRTVFPHGFDDGNGFVQGTVRLGGHRLVFLDTKQEGTHAGGYCQRRQAWLERTLAEDEGPVLLFMHHPLFNTGIAAMDALTQMDAQTIIEILAPHRQRIRHLFFGHVHRPIFGSCAGMPFSLIPGLNHQVPLALNPGDIDIPGSHEPPAYAIALIDERDVVVHLNSFTDTSRRFSLDGYEAQGRDYALNFPAA